MDAEEYERRRAALKELTPLEATLHLQVTIFFMAHLVIKIWKITHPEDEDNDC